MRKNQTFLAAQCELEKIPQNFINLSTTFFYCFYGNLNYDKIKTINDFQIVYNIIFTMYQSNIKYETIFVNMIDAVLQLRNQAGF